MDSARHLVARGFALLNEGLDCVEKETNEPVTVNVLDFIEATSVTCPYIWVELTFLDIELPSGDGSPPCHVVKSGPLIECNKNGFAIEHHVTGKRIDFLFVED